MRRLVFSLCAVAMTAAAVAGEAPQPLYPKVLIETTLGNLILELDGARSPITVRNFLGYIESGHYDGTIMHRVIPNFVVQGGGYTPDFKERENRDPIFNESGNGLSNLRGTIAMARTNEPHSATSQFYINLANNTRLDPNLARWGYCVFGEVIEGMEVLDTIAAQPTGRRGPFPGDVPLTPVVIKSMSLYTEPEVKEPDPTEAVEEGPEEAADAGGDSEAAPSDSDNEEGATSE